MGFGSALGWDVSFGDASVGDVPFGLGDIGDHVGSSTYVGNAFLS